MFRYACILLTASLVAGEILSGPIDVIAISGVDEVNLTCVTNSSDPVAWSFQNSKLDIDLTSNGRLKHKMRARYDYNVSVCDGRTESVLAPHEFNFNHAGTYTCVDDEDSRSAYVTVVEFRSTRISSVDDNTFIFWFGLDYTGTVAPSIACVDVSNNDTSITMFRSGLIRGNTFQGVVWTSEVLAKNTSEELKCVVEFCSKTRCHPRTFEEVIRVNSAYAEKRRTLNVGTTDQKKTYSAKPTGDYYALCIAVPVTFVAVSVYVGIFLYFGFKRPLSSARVEYAPIDV